MRVWGARKAYVLYGPLGPGIVDLSAVGSTVPGLVLYGETAGDRAGASVSWWQDLSGDGVDDFLIGAPGATTLDEFGDPIVEAGYVYAIHGGTSNLDAKAEAGGVIRLERVADGTGTQILGVVFLGLAPSGEIGRSVKGAVDVDGDGVADVLIGGNDVAWVIPGDGPKTTSGSTTLEPKPRVEPGGQLSRIVGEEDAVTAFGAFYFAPGGDGALGGLVVGGAGDANDDGVDDYVIGAPAAELPGKTGAGKAYVVFGSPAPEAGERLLSDVGETVPGLVVEGYEAGDALGSSVGGGFDVNADGVDDALVGAPFADSLAATPTDAGESYVISPVAPVEVVLLKLRATVTGTELEWTVPHRALFYNVYRGAMEILGAYPEVRTSNMTAWACGIETDADADGLPDTLDADSPAAGTGFFYLVTGENATGEGPLGPEGAVPARVLDSQCP